MVCPRCSGPIPEPKGSDKRPHGMKPKLCTECQEELQQEALLAQLSHLDD